MVSLTETYAQRAGVTQEQLRKLLTPKMTSYVPHKPYIQQIAFLLLEGREAFYGGAAGGGKALSVDTPIPTPDGWVRMGDIVPGMTVFGKDGKPTQVLATSGVMQDRPCYAITFDDGSVIVADEQHKWETWSLSERSQRTRRSDDHRTKRRSTRVKRGAGRRNDLSVLNKNKQHYVLEAMPSIRTTADIYGTIKTRGRTNHSIDNCSPVEYSKKDYIVDPYVLGVWLGDGIASCGAFTSDDVEIVNSLNEFKPRLRSGDYEWATYGLAPLLRRLGVLGNKHIPTSYLRGSKDQRLSLLQGLMDTDGNCDEDGGSEFCNTNVDLARGVYELAASLGLKPHFAIGRAKLYGKDCGEKYRVKFTTSVPVFRLTRKLARLKSDTRQTTKQRMIVSCEKVASCPVMCIQVSAGDGMFLAGKSFIPTHNSDALLMAALQYVDVPGYSALLLRRTYSDLSKPNAIMDRAKRWLIGTDAKWNDKEKTFLFPSGAKLVFGYLESEGDKYQYQGSEFQFVGFDELTQFTKTQYEFLFTRLRRQKGMKVPIRMRSASNPGGVGHSWVKQKFIPNKDDRKLDSKQRTKKSKRVFIPAKLHDNPYLDGADYLESLEEVDAVTRAQLVSGDWDITEGGKKFERSWFKIIPFHKVPRLKRIIRYWDLAATDPTEENKDPDFTAGCLFATGIDGSFYILDVRRKQGSPGTISNLLNDTAIEDRRIYGRNKVAIRLEREPGSAGIHLERSYRVGIFAGYPFKGVKSQGKGSKQTRAIPFASMAAGGEVYVVEGDWNEEFLDELEVFPLKGHHDDQVDAASGAFAELHQRNRMGVGTVSDAQVRKRKMVA